MESATQELKDKWNCFAGKYSQVLEEPNLQAALSLARMTGVHSANNILEIACGSGKLSLSLLKTLPPWVKYISIDISEEMIKMAKGNKKAVEQKLNDNIDHEYVEADGENLSFIADESMDVVIAPLCIHLTPDPNKILKEALRVLKKGGKLGVSVLGDPQKCTFLTLLENALKESYKETRNQFYLGSREKLIKLVQDNGFQVGFCWTAAIPFLVKSKEELREFWFPTYDSEKADEQTRQIVERMGKRFDEEMNNFRPLQTENVLLVASKPF